MLTTKTVGKRIAEARKKLNISQAQLAQHLSISSQAVGKWERGESMPDITTFNRLAEFLGVDLNYFSEGFKSTATEMASVDSLIKQPEEMLPGKQNKKRNWDMSRGNWVDADFSRLKNLHEKFSSSNMQRCKFNGSDLSGLILKSNNVDTCDFSNSDFSSSQIQNSNLAGNIFRNCSLKETKVSKSNIDRCDFSGANFTETEFFESYISGSIFTSANFTGMIVKSGGFSGKVTKSSGFEENKISDATWNHTSFIDSQITDFVFTGKLEDCYFENCVFTRVTFQNATLINTFFKSSTTRLKGIRFIDCKADRMTYEFLKSGKVDLTGVTLQISEESEE